MSALEISPPKRARLAPRIVAFFAMLATLGSPRPSPAQLLPPCDECRTSDFGCRGVIGGALLDDDCRFDGLRFVEHGLVLERPTFLSIFASGTGFEPHIALLGPDCELLGESKPAGPVALLELDAPAGELRVLLFESRPTNAVATYTLEIRCEDEPPPPPPPGQECDCLIDDLGCQNEREIEFPISGCRDANDLPIDSYFLSVEPDGPLVVEVRSRSRLRATVSTLDCRPLARAESDADGLARVELDGGFEPVLALTLTQIENAREIEPVSVDIICNGVTRSICDEACLRGDLNPGGTRSSTIDNEACRDPRTGLSTEVWTLSSMEALDLVLRVDTDRFDARLEVLDERCRTIATNQSCNPDILSPCLRLELEPGRYHVAVSAEDARRGEYQLAWEPPPDLSGSFFRGDTGGDGVLAIDDAVSLLEMLFRQGSAPECLETADANNDGRVDLTDGVVVLRFLFARGPAPAPPGPPSPTARCGPDPDPAGSPASLGCDRYAACPL